MTDPAPAGTPSTDPGQDPSTDPAPNTDPANPDPANPGTDPEGGEDARVTRANREAAQYRTERNALQQQLDQQAQEAEAFRQQVAKALGLAPDDEGTEPAAQVTELTSRVESLSSENASLRAELLVHNLAGDNGANANALLDSRGFLNTLQGLDPEAEDYRTKVADAIKAAVKSNANLAAVGQVPSRGGAPDAGAGSQQPAGSVTQDQFNAMSYAQRAELFRTNPDLYRRLAG